MTRAGAAAHLPQEDAEIEALLDQLEATLVLDDDSSESHSYERNYK